MACLLVRGMHEQLNRMAGVSPSAKPFAPTQGQYLAFIHLYTRLHRRPPAETDMQEYFRVSPPSVELSPKVGDGGNREGGISWGCLTPPLLHRRSDMPCPT